MALRNQPYLPLYVQDFLTDEKLAYCSAGATGVYIRIMCLMHKSEKYGTILLKQNFKQADKQVNNFALQLAKQLTYDLNTIQDALEELLSEGVLYFEGDSLVQKRMVKDSEISELRKNAGKIGGQKTQNKIKNFDSDFALAKFEANTENENVISNDIVLSSNVNNKGVEKIEKNLPAKRSKKQKTYLDDASFDQLMQMQGKEQVKIGFGLVYLRRSDYDKFIEEFGREMTHEMITQLDLYKSDNIYFSGKQLYVRDESVMRKSWVLKNAKDALQAKNSNIVHELKKTEKAQDKIKKLWLDQ